MTTPEATPEATTDHAFEVGREYGTEQAAWFEVGNAHQARTILRQLDDGDPAIYDRFPYPLSGEWAGESIPELVDRFGLDLEDEDIVAAFEEGFALGFEAELTRTAMTIAEGEVAD